MNQRQWGAQETCLEARFFTSFGTLTFSETRQLVSYLTSTVILVAPSCLLTHCDGWWGGAGRHQVEALLRALDDAVLAFIQSLSATLMQLRQLYMPGTVAREERDGGGSGGGGSGGDGGDGGSDGGGDAEDASEHVQGVLALLSVSGALLAHLGGFEANLQATLSTLRVRLGALAAAADGDTPGGILSPDVTSSSGAGLQAAYVQLAPAPERRRRLLTLLEGAADGGRFHALPRAAPRAAAFQDAIHSLVYDVLVSKVKVCVTGLGARDEWGVADDPSHADSGFELPTFSAYPKEYVTAVGEYLLTLPQQLETLSSSADGGGGGGGGGDDADDVTFFAASWLTKVAHGAAELYLEQLLNVPALSDRGAQQVCAVKRQTARKCRAGVTCGCVDARVHRLYCVVTVGTVHGRPLCFLVLLLRRRHAPERVGGLRRHA
jgi:hypothetical protein